jgi:hypothetical protein
LFEVADLEVLGRPIAVGPHGLMVGGRPAAPVVPDGGLPALLGALKEKGVELSFFPERKVPGGVQAGGLELRLVQAPPPQVASGVEAVVATVTFGGNQATVDNRALPSPPLFDTTTPMPGAPQESATATVAPSPAFHAEPAGGVSQGAEPGPWPGDGPTPKGSSAGPPAPSPASPAGGDSDQALGTEAITAEGLRVRLGGLYPILALSVFIAVAVAGSFRRLTGQRRA